MTYARCAITATRALCAGNYRGACTAYFLMGGCLYTAAGLLSFAGAPVGLYSAILLGPVVGATRALHLVTWHVPPGRSLTTPLPRCPSTRAFCVAAAP